MENVIIPSKAFNVPYPKILNNIDGIITTTERRLLVLFGRYAYKDGLIFPKQVSLAYKINISKRQIIRLIKSLVTKGFISVKRPTLVEKHCFGKGNTYCLIDNPVYHSGRNSKKICKVMSPDKACNSDDVSFIDNKINKTKESFNIIEFLKKNQHKHGQAIIDALNTLTSRWPSIKNPMNYAQKIINIQSPNYNESSYQQESEQIDKEVTQNLSSLASKLGIEFHGNTIVSERDKQAQMVSERQRQQDELASLFEY